MKKLEKFTEIGLSEKFAELIEQIKLFDSYDSNIGTEDFYMFDDMLTSSTNVTMDIQSSSCTDYFCE